MTRSSFKLPYIAKSLSSLRKPQLVESFLKLPEFKAEDSIRLPKIVYQRSSTITPEMIGAKVSVHSGQKFINFTITEEKVGYKFGEFALTKKRALYKKKKKR